MPTDQAACMGCFVNNPNNWNNPNWYKDWPPEWPVDSHKYDSALMLSRYLGLTEMEKECLKHLVDAWNCFVQLEGKHPSDNPEFCDAIHAAQKMLALRVARRVDTDVWSQWPKEHLPTDPIT